MTTMRKLTTDDAKSLAKLWRYCFNPDPNNFKDLKEEKLSKFIPRTLGYFVNDEINASISNLDYKINIRGSKLKIAAIAGVATYPQVRRQGIIKKLFKKVFNDMVEQDQYISALYPFKFPYYEKFGYKVVSSSKVVRLDLDSIKYLPTEKPVTIKFVEDLKDIQVVYEKASEKYHFIFDRDAGMWEEKILDMWTGWKGYKFVAYDDSNQPIGYAIVSFHKFDWNKPHTDDNRIDLLEYFWINEDAKKAILNFLKNHDSQRKFAIFREIEDHTELYLTDTEKIERKEYPGIMFRVVHVVKALEQIKIPAITGKFTFKIHDDQCEWNDGVFKIVINREKVDITKDDSQSYDFECGIGTFSQLYAGYSSYEKLLKIGDIKVYSDNDIPSVVFPEMSNLPRDEF